MSKEWEFLLTGTPKAPPRGANREDLIVNYSDCVTQPLHTHQHSCHSQLQNRPYDDGIMSGKRMLFTDPRRSYFAPIRYCELKYSPITVEASGTAPESDRLITTPVYYHSSTYGVSDGIVHEIFIREQWEK